jgi:hypothetical protein
LKNKKKFSLPTKSNEGTFLSRTGGRLRGGVRQNGQQRCQNLPRMKNCCVCNEEKFNFMLVKKTWLWPRQVQWLRWGGGSAGLSGANAGLLFFLV